MDLDLYRKHRKEAGEKSGMLWKQLANIVSSIFHSFLIVLKCYSMFIIAGFSVSYFVHGMDLLTAIDKDMMATLLLSALGGLSAGAFEVLILNKAGFKNVYKEYALKRVQDAEIAQGIKKDLYRDVKEYVPWYINKLREESRANNNK